MTWHGHYIYSDDYSMQYILYMTNADVAIFCEMHNLNVHSHDVVCDDVHFGSVFRRCGSVQTDWALMDLRGEWISIDTIFAQRLIHFILEWYALCFLRGQWDGLVKLLLGLKVKQNKYYSGNMNRQIKLPHDYTPLCLQACVISTRSFLRSLEAQRN